MLKLLSSENQVLQVDDFYILEKSSGLDELVFNISIYDENYPYILEEAVIEYEQPYLVKAIDGGSDTAKVKCQLDLDELKADMHVGYSNNSNTLFLTVNPILPDGWVFIDESGSRISRTIEGDFTPYDIIAECASTYDVVFRFKPKERQVYAYSLSSFQPLGTFASRELNLKEINYKGKSTDFFTRLYAYGEDGLSFAAINDGNEYVDNFEYTDKIICTVMRDERYTTMEGLLEAAKKAVKTGGIPTCSYECTVYDLAATNPEMYKFQDFSLFSVVKLIDDVKKISVNHQVVEYKRYPKYPEKNVVTLSTTTTKLQNTVKNLKNEIENPQSAFRVLMQNTIDNMASSIAGYKGGNMIITKNDDGKPNGIMIMDTESQDTAKHVLWFNLSGITYSSNGIDGPYNSVWSFEKGGFVADWIVTGTLLANVIKTGVLSDAKGTNYWNLDTGEMKMSAYSEQIEILQKEIDGAIETHYYDYEPTLENEPASLWTTDEEKLKHEGDLFYWKSKGYAYRFFNENGEWSWVLVQDTDVTKALANAAAALETAEDAKADAENAQNTAENVQTELNETTSEIRQEILEQNTSLTKTCEELILEASKNYALSGDYETFKQDISTQLSVLAEQLSIKTTEIVESLENVNGDLQSQLNTITQYFTFNIDGMTVGQSDKPSKVVIDDDIVAILMNNIEVFKADALGHALIQYLQITKGINLFGLLIEEPVEGRIDCGYVGGDS